MGFFNIASGASSFAKGRDWQLFSRISGFIADAGSTSPIGDTGPPSSGGSSLLGYFEGEEGGGPTGGGKSGSVLDWLFGTLGNLAGTVAHAEEREGGAGRGWWHRHPAFGKGYENASRFFRDKFNPSRGELQHLLDPSKHRPGLGRQWGIHGPTNNQNIAQMRNALQAHMDHPLTRVIPGTSGSQQLPAVHFYNPLTRQVVSINPHTGGLRVPTGYRLTPSQADTLLDAGQVGIR